MIDSKRMMDSIRFETYIGASIIFSWYYRCILILIFKISSLILYEISNQSATGSGHYIPKRHSKKEKNIDMELEPVESKKIDERYLQNVVSCMDPI